MKAEQGGILGTNGVVFNCKDQTSHSNVLQQTIRGVLRKRKMGDNATQC